MWSQQWESSLRSPGKVWAQESAHLCPIRLIQINHMSQIALQSRTARTGWTLRVILQSGCPKRAWIKTLFSWELLVSLSSTRQIIFHLLFQSSQAKQKIKIELRGSAGSVRIHLWILPDKTCFEDCLFFTFYELFFWNVYNEDKQKEKKQPWAHLFRPAEYALRSRGTASSVGCKWHSWAMLWVGRGLSR